MSDTNELDVTRDDQVLALRLVASAYRDDDFGPDQRDLVYLEVGLDPVALYRLLLATMSLAVGAIAERVGGLDDVWRAATPDFKRALSDPEAKDSPEGLAVALLWNASAARHVAPGTSPEDAAEEVNQCVERIFGTGDFVFVRATISAMVQLHVVHRVRHLCEVAADDAEREIARLLDDPREEES
ncbi:hypothetical protein [Gordonia sputi]